MKAAVRYDPTTGKILGGITVSDDQLLPTELANPTSRGFLVVSPDHPALTKQQQWTVTSAGQLAKRDLIAVSVFPSVFSADGVTPCTLTVTGIHSGRPARFRCDSAVLDVTAADPTIVLTSDVPRTFVLVLDAGEYALDPEPRIVVRAE